MSEPAKQQMGDGQDNFGQAAGKAAQAAKQASKEAAKQAAAKGAEATANAAANTVKAGVEGGKAVAEIAAGTASGGPWGAIISAAWAMRHTLYKILICICLVLVFLIVMIASLPSIIWDYLMGGGDNPAFSSANAASVVVAYRPQKYTAIRLGWCCVSSHLSSLISEILNREVICETKQEDDNYWSAATMEGTSSVELRTACR